MNGRKSEPCPNGNGSCRDRVGNRRAQIRTKSESVGRNRVGALRIEPRTETEPMLTDPFGFSSRFQFSVTKVLLVKKKNVKHLQ